VLKHLWVRIYAVDHQNIAIALHGRSEAVHQLALGFWCEQLLLIFRFAFSLSQFHQVARQRVKALGYELMDWGIT
jgi:hypothetical protein